MSVFIELLIINITNVIYFNTSSIVSLKFSASNNSLQNTNHRIRTVSYNHSDGQSEAL